MFYGIGKDDKKGFRLSDENFRNKINRISYIVKNELAQREILTYYSKSYSVNLILTHKYIVINVGKSKKMKKYSRKITNVE